MLYIETGTENAILRKKSQPVLQITKDIKRLLKKMEEAMLDESGIGLAAPQVGVHLRVILITIFKEFIAKDGKIEYEEDKILPMINPVITSFSVDTEMGEEGCLSIPGFYDNVRRSKAVEVEFLDLSGKKQKIRLSGLNAREVQHEIDHLDGKLFTDYLEPEKVERANKIVEKKLMEK
ncbi:MAG: peptide deformylase [Candidatus Gracilibacteria bacterium]